MLCQVNLNGVHKGHERGHASSEEATCVQITTAWSSSDLYKNVLDPIRGRMLMECGKVGRFTKSIFTAV